MYNNGKIIPKSTYFKLVFGTSLSILFIPATVHAADSDDQSTSVSGAGQNDLGEIVVTARKRAESAQSIPLSIEVLQGDSLIEQGVLSTADLTQATTGVQASASGFNQIYIRGVGDYGVTISANPAVVTNINGIPISRSQVIGGNFYDLERVEVLKGPQGTLYGRNASGGAVNLITVKPKLEETSGYIFASYGNYNALQTEAAINVPLGSTVAVRMSGQAVNRDGYLTDGTSDDVHQSLRAQGLYEEGPFTAQVRVGYQHIGGKGAGLALIPSLPGESAWTGTASKEAMDYFIGQATANFVASGGTSPPPSLLARLDDPSFKLFQDAESVTIDAQFDYAFDGATLTVIPAYRWVHSRFSFPVSYYYGGGAGDTDGDRSKQYSVEARLGNSDDKLDWVVGVFGLKEDVSSDFLVDFGDIQRVRISSDQTTQSFAVFGEATYSMTDELRLSLGGRWTTDKREAGNVGYAGISPTFTRTPPCLPSTGFPVGAECSLLPPGASFDSSKVYKRATWRLGVEYDIAPQNMFFANVTTGFKAGGFNIAVDPSQTDQLLPFGPENVTAYTVGLRNRFANNAIQLNFEGFYWNYKDLQLSQIIIDGIGNIAAATQNAGKARIYGFNIDAIVKPFNGTTLRGSVEYLNTKYQSYSYVQAGVLTPPGSVGCAVSPSSLPAGALGPFVEIDCSGFQLARAPKWSGNAGVTQVIDLAGGGDITFDGDIAFATKRYVANSFSSASLDGSYGILSAMLTYNEPNGDWSIGGFVRNITNTAAKIGGGEQSPYVPEFLGTGILPPRTYGVNARVSF